MELVNQYIDGKGLGKGARQKLAKHYYARHDSCRLYTIGPKSHQSDAISGSGEIKTTYEVALGALGVIKAIWFTVGVTVASAAVQLCPSPFFLRRLALQKGLEQEEIQAITPEVIHEYLQHLGPADWKRMHRALNYTSSGLANGSKQGVETRYYVIPVPLCALLDIYGKGFNPGLKQEVTAYFQPAVASGTAGNVSISDGNITLNIEYEELPSPLATSLAAKYNVGIEHSFLHAVTHSELINVSASQKTIVQLTGLRGRVAHLWWTLRASQSNANNAMLKYQKIGDSVAKGQFRLLNAAQDSIFNGAFDAYSQNKIIAGFRHMDGAQDSADGVYRVFFNNPEDIWHQGKYSKYFTFTGQEYLEFTTAAANAETPRVVEMTSAIAAGTETNAAAGNFQILYTVPEHPAGPRSFMTPPLNYNISAADLTTYLNAMLGGQSDGITITGTNQFSADKKITLTVTGINAENDWHSDRRNASFSILHDFRSGSDAILVVNVFNATASVPASGFGPGGTGDYWLDVRALVIRNQTIRGRNYLEGPTTPQ